MASVTDALLPVVAAVCSQLAGLNIVPGAVYNQFRSFFDTLNRNKVRLSALSLHGPLCLARSLSRCP